MAVVHVTYFTDPACPWSWAAEPAVRRLEVEFAEEARITYVMGGLAREFRRPHETLRHVLDASAASGMPVDGRLWLDAPPASSYPACQAVKAAAEQGLDVERFTIDLHSNASVEAFGADLERARAAGIDGAPRVDLPSFSLQGEDGKVHWLRDSWEPGPLRAAAIAAGATPRPLPDLDEALRRFGSMAAAEVAAVCDMPGPRAPTALWQAASEWRARPEAVVAGELWSAA